MTTSNLTNKLERFPVLPLRDVVVYPHMVIPLFVGRERSINALDAAMREDKQILLVSQVDSEQDDPGADDLHKIGTLANILQLLKLPDNTVKVLVEGSERSRIQMLDTNSFDYLLAAVEPMQEIVGCSDQELEGLVRTAINTFEQYVKLNKKIPPEVLNSLTGIESPGRLADTIAAHMNLKIEDKQAILESEAISERLESLVGLMDGEVDILELEQNIRGRVKQQMEKNQREYYLNEQMKAIQKELGDMDEVPNELDELANKIKDSGMSKEALSKSETELNKLKMMSPMSAEATVVRNYIDWMVKVPWKTRSRVSHNLKKAEEILEADHYGLDKIKERILEYLAVQQRVRKMRGPILCLVGPPGVGKTSLGQSIARATNRKYVRMALGGVRDEAEIRGHRRTYIGSMPGKILQNLAKVGTRNPMFLLDEIDKMAMDFRGDPASALLEVLDAEQNNTFNDHYLEVDFDLSDVMFVATANTLNIPPALLDRMEVIRLPGYTEAEKINIAERYLLPKQLKNNGLKKNELEISESAMQNIIRLYTREAGVRNLEREIAKISRKVVKELLLSQKDKKLIVNEDNLGDFLGVERFRFGRAEEQDRVGQVTGLAWTEVGGELLTIEVAIYPGKGKLTRTGKLGEVMQESIQAAETVVHSRAEALGIEDDFFQSHDLHVHVPEGAIPKDGPSAGIGMCTALVSAITGIPVRANVAMTGEITLRGEVLPIGGLKEKLLAAHRGGLNTILIPKQNEKDLIEVPDDVKSDLDIRLVQWIDEVLDVALIEAPRPVTDKNPASKRDKSEKADTLTAH
ncbi:MAG: endopeptidase La [Gammaproteobacteria bacterium]|nr:endopeptidase La [Gammaproteobacteria bacterium]